MQGRCAGASVPLEPEDAFRGGYHGYFADPDGHPWEIAWAPQMRTGEDGSVRLGSSLIVRRTGPSFRFGHLIATV